MPELYSLQVVSEPSSLFKGQTATFVVEVEPRREGISVCLRVDAGPTAGTRTCSPTAADGRATLRYANPSPWTELNRGIGADQVLIWVDVNRSGQRDRYEWWLVLTTDEPASQHTVRWFGVAGPDRQTRDELLVRINDYRASQRRPRLPTSAIRNDRSESLARDDAILQELRHSNTPGTRENLARAGSSRASAAQRVLDAWIGSAPHNANLLATDVVNHGAGIFWVTDDATNYGGTVYAAWQATLR